MVTQIISDVFVLRKSNVFNYILSFCQEVFVIFSSI